MKLQPENRALQEISFAKMAADVATPGTAMSVNAKRATMGATASMKSMNACQTLARMVLPAKIRLEPTSASVQVVSRATTASSM